MGKVVPDQVYDRSKPPGKVEFRYANALAHCPGFTLVGLQVTFPPGGATPPHRHGGAEVAATVLKGSTYNKMNDEPTRLLEAGEVWHEGIGCHHKTSANASDTEELVIFANLVVPSVTWEQGGIAAVVVIDEEWR